MTESKDGDSGGSPDSKFLVPILGLLSIVFAVMAGASLSYAMSRPSEMLLVPAGLAAASVGCLYLKRKFSTESADGADA